MSADTKTALFGWMMVCLVSWIAMVARCSEGPIPIVAAELLEESGAVAYYGARRFPAGLECWPVQYRATCARLGTCVCP